MSQLVFIQTHAPHGSIMGQETLDACLMGSAFASCALLFIGDGIYQLLRRQNTQELGVKDYSVSYGVLQDYGVEAIFCRQSDLDSRGLTTADLVIEVQVINDSEARNVIKQAEQVLTF